MLGLMSKAFTREDDDAQQLDVLPERPISHHPNLVTAEGLAQIEGNVTRPLEEQAASRATGDAAATAAASRDLRYWNARLASAQLTESRPSSQVQFGSHVEIKRADGSTITYRIVGSDEGDPSQGTLSYVSPLAQALMGKEVGDAVTVGPNDVEITKIT